MKAKGKYKVIFKHPFQPLNRMSGMFNGKIDTFIGLCENFNPNGLVTFINEDEEILLVNYNDIIQMKPIKEDGVK